MKWQKEKYLLNKEMTLNEGEKNDMKPIEKNKVADVSPNIAIITYKWTKYSNQKAEIVKHNK